MIPYVGTLEKMFRDAGIAARSNEAVLILGETGVGKEILAHHIHLQSRRQRKSFLPINCAAIPSHLVESELFGSEKGAYTGAVRRKGLLEEADGGTVFLDEITEIPLEVQAKLLRTIETKQFLPLGTSRYRSLDVRFIAASNSDIRQRLDAGQFRRDLYYRLAIFVYTIPPLRQRPADVSGLARSFLSAEQHTAGISMKAMELMLCYAWPGNVRELKNAMTHAMARTESAEILPEHLPDHIQAGCPHPEILHSSDMNSKLECFEAEILKDAMQKFKEPEKAAQHLGMGVRTLYRRLKKYNIQH